ncbi:hypothetical protein [Bradyrhizobium sp. CSA112]|uniref:hypothetical protein n=1 Tax=Bradyrhizobium sp. CSA112 TaxID=2699170 RepID=UPI0023AF333A|nr:hypothetical protein [Bradyrhizobium sp. CSA112]
MSITPTKAMQPLLVNAALPNRFPVAMRETARFLLEPTRLSVDEIALRVGYAEPSTPRRLIRRDTKHAPGHFRPAA